MNAFLAGLCGVLIVAGVLSIALGAKRPGLPSTKGPGRARAWAALRRQGWRLGLSLILGVVLALLTGWPTLTLLIPTLGYALPTLLTAPPNRDLALLEALDRWVHQLGSLLPTGRSIADAIRVSARRAPGLLAPGLRSLTTRLDQRWSTDQALLALAEELDSADADAVLAALVLASQRGGTGASATLTALADNVQDRLRALREIDTERAKPRIVVRQVTVITLLMLGGAMAFGRDFFAPYASGPGQLILLALVVSFLGSLLILRQVTLPRARARILRRIP